MSRSESGHGYGFSRTVWMTEKIALFAPMHSASVRMATTLNPGLLESERSAYLKSCMRIVLVLLIVIVFDLSPTIRIEHDYEHEHEKPPKPESDRSPPAPARRGHRRYESCARRAARN